MDREDILFILNKVDFKNFTAKDLLAIGKVIKSTRSYDNFILEEHKRVSNPQRPKLRVI